MLAPPPERAAPDLGSVVAALPVAMLLADPNGRIAFANPACEQLLNRSARALIGCPLSEVLGLALPDRPEFSLIEAELGGAGEGVRADVSAAALPDQPGWRTYALHAVSRRRSGSPSAGRAAIGAAAMLAHEIKNPLSGIRGAAQLLAGSAPASPLTTLITTEVDRIATLIDRMEAFTDTRPLPLVAANVHPLVEHVRQLIAVSAGDGVALRQQFDPSLPPALLDRDALIQVLLNLARNAIEAGAATIVFGSAYRAGVAIGEGNAARRALAIELSVSDDGPGVPADLVDHLYEPFVSGRPEGRGLGLALVDRLVGQMGGLVLHARERDRTVFRVLLPRAEG